VKGRRKVPPSGQIRQSQIITTFGPGAMVDLPDHSVLIGGLDHWSGNRRRIMEERLEARVCEQLGLEQVAMYAPPVDVDNEDGPRVGITSFTFPAWFVAQVDNEMFKDPSGKVYRSRPLVHWQKMVKGKYLSRERKSVPVVPVRFVQGCRNGHLSDIDWYSFVHEDFHSTCRGQLWLEEGGTGGDLADIFVRCEACKRRRVLGLVKIEKAAVLGRCMGQRPWLGPRAAEKCQSQTHEGAELNRLLVRSASNVYFAQVLSAISIPDRAGTLRKAVDPIWEDELQYIEDLEDLQRLRRKNKPKVAAQLNGFTDEEVWTEIRRRRAPPAKAVSIKQAEIETLLSSQVEESEDIPEEDFYARARSLDALPAALSSKISRIVLVHRLREVQAQVGFTRFEAVVPDIDGELALGVQRAALAIETTWVPAIENRGEGVFLAFQTEAVRSWLRSESVVRRGKQLEAGFNAWCRAKGLRDARFSGLPYIMLHSLAHLLITAVSLECGYAASAIRERVYAGESGYGILLYTGTTGSEGTLGGLVQVGKHIEQHLQTALELGRLCSSDPVCAQHRPDDRHEERFLHGAACHGCLLIAEPSCERRNELLDRALVVPTVERLGAEFFPEPGLVA
jgi:hypothetical protein